MLVARVGRLLAAAGKEEEKGEEGGHCSTGKLSVSPAPRPKAAGAESAASHNFLLLAHSAPHAPTHLSYSDKNRERQPQSYALLFETFDLQHVLLTK